MNEFPLIFVSIVNCKWFIAMERTYISFDWAAKRILRQKANFGILEGFLSELLKKEITITSILESESNKEHKEDKSNQVDLLCEEENGDLIIIEIQFYDELDYFQRVLYGISKVISEHISTGQPYENVKKVYSVNILYFDIGSGTDYVYHGTMNFFGIHHKDQLTLSKLQQEKFSVESPSGIFPEIFLIKVNNFDDIARTPLDEWIYFLKNTKLPEKYSAKGLKQLNQKLNYDKMDTTSKQEYDDYMTRVQVSRSVLETAKYKGREEGRIEENTKIILKMHDLGQEIAFIAEVVEISEEEVLKILEEHGRGR
ncbi:MAG: Rpn family recombination-promoting nuclease/putative transposase [Saprospirales bacterium]|nr:MAG: Rpn family recombination-promoting nuclease/putative transposase [Saprospirales bacterium]